MYKFNGFTQKANSALNLAISSAEDLGHTYVGSEHILLGLLKEGSGLAALILEDAGVSIKKYIEILINKFGAGVKSCLTAEDFTPKTRRILEASVIRATKLSCEGSVGTEHVLLSVLNESDCSAVLLLKEMGINLSNLIAKTNSESKLSNTLDEREKRGKLTKTPLEQFGIDLTNLAKIDKIDPVIGREEETQRVIQILSRRTKNNPCLVGEPGVGKTAIAEGLAIKIANKDVPEYLKEKRIISLNLTNMVAGTKYRGDFETRIKSVIEQVKNDGDIILFIDELHTIIGAGSAEGSADAANILKPVLGKGDIQIIGATTFYEYRKYIEKDAALERRFQPVKVEEPSEKESLKIIRGIKDKYESHHRVKISDEAIEAAVKLSVRYLPDRYLPDKAIDLIDEAASKVRMSKSILPKELKRLEDNIINLEKRKTDLINNQEFEKAANIRDKEYDIRSELERERILWLNKNNDIMTEVNKEDIASVVSSWTKIPVRKLDQEESEKLINMEKELHKRIVGQEEAVNAVSRAIRRSKVGLNDPKMPVGSFIFLGPTGVGKTELCKALAYTMFGDEESIIKLDMSEYMEKHSVSKLIGSPPGYVGFNEGGQLTEKVRKKPYCVLLFDEIEKAHSDVFNLLLQVLEDGNLTDSQGRTVDFRNAIIIMTSNIGARIITNEKGSLGFSTSNETFEYNKDKVLDELKKFFKPEFLNRIDDVVMFKKLDKSEIAKIVKNMLAGLKERAENIGIDINFTENIINEISKEGFNPLYGARPIRKLIRSKIEDKLSEKILKKEIKPGEAINCDYIDGEIKILCLN